jgi:hypothetical protein
VPSLTKIVTSLTSYRRDQQKQSMDARSAALSLGWSYANSTDLLRYEDGKVVVPFSHEALLLGNGKTAFTSPLAINAAKLAYFRVMSSGNGCVFRALVPKIETANGQGAVLKSDLVPPACFTNTSVRFLFSCLGINPLPSAMMCDPLWRQRIQPILLSSEYIALKDAVFQALRDISIYHQVATEQDFKDSMRSVKFVTLLDVGAQAESLYKPMKFLQRLGQFRTKQIMDRYYSIPSRAVRQMNEAIAKMSS